MPNSIESVRRRTEATTSFVWNFRTSASPWRADSPVFHLHDDRECRLAIEGTYTNNCVSSVEYRVRLRLAFEQEHTGQLNETFEAKIRLDKREYRFKLGKLTDQELSDELLVHHHVSLSRQNLQLQVELVCRTQEGKNKNLAGLSRDLQRLLDSGYQSDLDIEVGDAVFKAHRAILGCRSNVLAKMIEHDMLERRTGRIILWDWEPQAVRRLLTYIYTGKYALSRDAVHELFRLAHYLELHELQTQCKLYMLLNLSADSLADTLRLTFHEQYDMADVHRAAMRFIAANEAQCAGNADLLEYLCHSLDIESLGFVLSFANRHRLEKTLLAAMDFVKHNFKQVMANERLKSYLLSEPHLLIKMLELPTDEQR